MERKLQQDIMKWYKENARELPWRKTKDPYVIWLSEIIMQQTRIEQGTPYFNKFVSSFPTVFDLARASEDQVLKHWQGLGYYSRARNMHHAAKTIVEKWNGHFPSNYDDLISLKGIGDYTASALLSFCHHQPYAVLDGNVFRLLSRLFGIEEPINSTIGKKIFKKKANEFLDQSNPGDFNQALMDFGAMVCKPNNPACTSCPLQFDCVAKREQSQASLPTKLKAKDLKKRYLHYFVFKQNGSLFIKKRNTKGIWFKLYELPLLEKMDEGKLSLIEVRNNFSSDLEEFKLISSVKHLLSHQELYISFYEIDRGECMVDEAYLEIAVSEIQAYPFPKPIIEFLDFYY